MWLKNIMYGISAYEFKCKGNDSLEHMYVVETRRLPIFILFKLTVNTVIIKSVIKTVIFIVTYIPYSFATSLMWLAAETAPTILARCPSLLKPLPA